MVPGSRSLHGDVFQETVLITSEIMSTHVGILLKFANLHFLQCFDTVRWVTGRALGMLKNLIQDLRSSAIWSNPQ